MKKYMYIYKLKKDEKKYIYIYTVHVSTNW